MMPTDLYAEQVIFTGAVAASVIAFIASTVLYIHTKWRVRPNRGTLRCLYAYCSIFFGGAALLCVDWMMADRAPVPLRPPIDVNGRMGFAVLLVVWALACTSAFMAQRMLRVIRKPQATPEGRNLITARTLHAEGRLHGRREVRHPRNRPATAVDCG